MTAAVPSIAIATNAEADEFAAWQLAAALLGEALEGQYRIALAQHASPEAALAAPATLVGLSLLAVLENAPDYAEVEAALERCCATIPPERTVFVATILRHLPDAQPGAMARLRRLNLLAARLSQHFGLLVIDIDRALAHRGALSLETDARLTGARGREAAARLMAHAVLCYGLAGVIDDDVLDRAITAYEAGLAPEIDRLTLPAHLVARQVSRAGGRTQVYLAQGPAFDERTFRGLLRDLRRGRLAPTVVAMKIGRKVGARVLAKSRSRLKRD